MKCQQDSRTNASRTSGDSPHQRLAHRKPTIEMETTEAVLDNGATSFVVGSRTLEKYLGQLQARGYDAETVKIFSCTKAFRFGNDKTGAALG